MFCFLATETVVQTKYHAAVKCGKQISSQLLLGRGLGGLDPCLQQHPIRVPPPWNRAWKWLIHRWILAALWNHQRSFLKTQPHHGIRPQTTVRFLQASKTLMCSHR